MAGKTQAADLTGQKFGSRLVLRRNGFYKKTTRAAWLCRCEMCGVETTVEGSSLRRLGSSCVCRNGGKVQHGMTGSRIYAVWNGMHSRCENPKNQAYHRYGGRGIKVCERWHDFSTFLGDMGVPKAGLTLDRMDNNGDYGPWNCRWATAKEQAQNTIHTIPKNVTSLGVLTVRQIAKIVGVTTNAIYARMRAGKKHDQLLTPNQKRKCLYTT